ncbi:MAG: Usg family protein [Alphaproteobacteria bacterium]|nr:Usg family protein [Alphaproteobacteria bacterium]
MVPASPDFLRQLEGYRLTTAEITYHRPDHPAFLQQFIWQELDLAPQFPALQRFLDFWEAKIEGKIHSVRVASTASSSRRSSSSSAVPTR